MSVAVRLPAAEGFSDPFKWYLFYKMYHEGYAIDADIGRARNRVDSLLTKFRDNSKLVEVRGVTDEDLLVMAGLPAFREMQNLSRRAVETNAHLRSVSSELLAGLWLNYQGYGHVRVSFKRTSLGDSDYDAIGIKDGQCLIIEVKPPSTVDTELREEVGEFANRIEFLRRRLPELARELAFENTIKDISGLFISLARLENFERSGLPVTLWGYDDYVKELRSARVSPRLIELLERTHIIHHIHPDQDLPDDPFLAGV